MPRKNASQKVTRPTRGRPPLPARTALARWIRDRGWTVAALVAEMRRVATRVGLTAADVPNVKTMLDPINARHWPSPTTMLIVRQVTGGAVDLQHWVRDLHSPR